MRFAVVGVGRMGNIHKDSAESVGWDCQGLIDLRFGGASEVQSDYGGSVHRALSDFLPYSRVDCFVLASTTVSRTEDLLTLLRAGFGGLIITEKPLANGVALAREAVNRAENNGATLVVNHQRRLLPVYQRVFEDMHSGRWGALKGMVVSGTNFGLANNVSHFVNLACHFFGRRPERVQSILEDGLLTSHRGPGFSDRSGILRVWFGEDRVFDIDFRKSLAHGQIVVLVFDQGKVVIDEVGGMLWGDFRHAEDFSRESFRYAERQEKIWGEYPQITSQDATQILYRRIDAGEKLGGLAEALWTVETLVSAMVSSTRLGDQTFEIDSELEPFIHERYSWS